MSAIRTEAGADIARRSGLRAQSAPTSRAPAASKGRLILVALAFLAVAAGALGCTAKGTRFSGRRALAHVRRQMDMGPRFVGSVGHGQAADYIVAQLQASGWQVSEDAFAYGGQNLRTIIGKKGHGPVALLGAHYDTRALANRDPEDRTQPVPGANDGGSGTAVLLELARVLTAPATEQYEIWLVFFDGEDHGEIENWPYSVGAYHLVNELARTGAIQPSFVVVADMIGDDDQKLYYEWSSTLALQERVFRVARELGYGAHFIPENRHHIIDDHTAFLQWGIPSALLIDFDYPYWHTTQDTLDKISADSLQRVGAVLETLLNGEPFVAR